MSTTPSAGPARHAGEHATATPRAGASRRRRVRPLGDGTTERVRLIEFLWSDGVACQPVLLLERTLLD